MKRRAIRRGAGPQMACRVFMPRSGGAAVRLNGFPLLIRTVQRVSGYAWTCSLARDVLCDRLGARVCLCC
jgi:hypothetical protein